MSEANVIALEAFIKSLEYKLKRIKNVQDDLDVAVYTLRNILESLIADTQRINQGN